MDTRKIRQAGEQAPGFEGIDEKGNTIRLTDFRGSKLALFFYPADMTPACTKEVCSLRDGYTELREAGYKLLGVSPDKPGKHQRFIDKYDLPFSLVADEDKTIANLYGVWGPKTFMGRTFDGIHRTTFLIDAEGVITRVIEKVVTKDHAAQILEKDRG